MARSSHARGTVSTFTLCPVVSERVDVCVVGGGLLGLCTAFALRGRRSTIVLERATVGHARGGSHGPSRVFRLGYPDRKYVEMAMQALPMWRALEAETGRALLETTGQLTFGPGAASVYETLAACNAPVEPWSDAIAEQFPMFAAHGPAIYEPASGVIAAADVLDALRSRVDVREGVNVVALDRTGRVSTDDGVIDAGVVVLSAGPWTKKLLDVGETFATLEHVAYFRPPPDTVRAPVFIDFNQPAVYGLPSPGSDLYKLALHHGGARVDPDGEVAVDLAAVDALRSAAGKWLPDYELVDVDVCLYDNTPTEDFIIERVDDIVIGCGTSGHGFKFGPLLGEMLADLCLRSVS
jgi:sarcosine oxidase